MGCWTLVGTPPNPYGGGGGLSEPDGSIKGSEKAKGKNCDSFYSPDHNINALVLRCRNGGI